MSLTDSREALREACLALLWAQWTELGVAGTAGSSAAIIDPEALLVASLHFGRYDPRLFDEVLDWLTLCGDLLDVTRLRRLMRSAEMPMQRLATTIVEFMRQTPSRSRWEPTAQRWLAMEAKAAYSPESLFLAPDGSDLPTLGAHDSFFASHGFLRPPLSLRHMSRRPRASRPSLLRLAARELVGLGVRAETLVYLWTHDVGHGRLIAERSGYAQRQVAEYLAGLADGGFAEKYDRGRTVQYRLLPGAGRPGARLARYVDWAAAYGTLVTFHSALTAAGQQEGGYESSIVLRGVLEELRRTLPLEGLDVPLPRPDDYPAKSLVPYAETYVADLVGALASLAG